ncbi:ABC transporter substrate-binding protein [Actinomycetes bacterium KLBMP 9797]
MRGSKRAGAVALGAAFALVVAGCGGGDEDTGDTDKTATGAITINGTEPENPLVPANTTETGGGKIVDYLWSGLTQYDNNTGESSNLLAESIETTDSKVYTIKIKKDTKFHDGTVVKAENFTKAWNWAAYTPNGAQGASFFSEIEGYADVTSVDPDDDGPKKAPEPKAKEMSGLKVVDETTFTVTLTKPFSIWPTKLGYSAFVPMPDSFFTGDPAAFGKKPIGNGPVKFVSWTNNVDIKLTRVDDYTLSDKVKIKDVTVKLYQDDNAAYNDLLANNLDFMQQVPVSALAGDKWKTDLGDRGLSKATPVTQIIAFPVYDPKFKSADLRKAISLSINRQEIAEKIFFNTRKPATTWSNPLAPGSQPNDCTFCKFDATEAKRLLQQAGGFTGELVLYYNADASHREWMEAVANQIKNNLGINARAQGIATFAELRQRINAKQMDGPYRAAWQQDYPDVENWLAPLYVTGGSSNDGGFSNPQVDALYNEGAAATNADAAHAKFQEAFKIIDAEMPSMPIVTVEEQSGYSTKIKNVETSNVGELDLSKVEIA